MNKITDKQVEKLMGSYEGTPFGRNSSVHNSDYRLNKAKEQVTKDPVDVDDIIDHVNHFLERIGIDQVESPKFKFNDENTVDNINYTQIQEKYDLVQKNHIIWLKFTEDGYLGVVARGADINFDIPLKKEDYIEKEDGNWKFNSSGILVHQVEKNGIHHLCLFSL